MACNFLRLATGCCFLLAAGYFCSAGARADDWEHDDWEHWRMANAAEDIAFELRMGRTFPDNACNHHNSLGGGYYGTGYGYGSYYRPYYPRFQSRPVYGGWGRLWYFGY